jgi:hypothetical protein
MHRISLYVAIVCALLAAAGVGLCFFALPLARALGNVLDAFGMPLWLLELWLGLMAISLTAIAAVWRAVEATRW